MQVETVGQFASEIGGVRLIDMSNTSIRCGKCSHNLWNTYLAAMLPRLCNNGQAARGAGTIRGAAVPGHKLVTRGHLALQLMLIMMQCLLNEYIKSNKTTKRDKVA